MTEETTNSKPKKRTFSERAEALRGAGLRNLDKLRTREAKARSEYEAIRREREELEKELGIEDEDASEPDQALKHRRPTTLESRSAPSE